MKIFISKLSARRAVTDEFRKGRVEETDRVQILRTKGTDYDRQGFMGFKVRIVPANGNNPFFL